MNPDSIKTTDAGCERATTPSRTGKITATVEVWADNDFSTAFLAAIRGARITRKGWNASGQWVKAQYPDKGSMMQGPYAYIKNSNNELVPWVPSQGDLFACDWAILPE